MVRRAKLNPTGLRWEGFVVAETGGRVVGIVQLRRHADGATELASLVIEPEARGQGIVKLLVDGCLAGEDGPVHAVLDRRYAADYARWGFAPVAVEELPRSIARTLRIGRVATAVGSVIRRDRIRLVPILRPAGQ